MAAAQFSDDAYNKQLQGGAGTLIGNWAEEQVLRESCGEGRCIPMRHIPRSGLLQDFSKKPATGARRMDNTFERVYGPKAVTSHVPVSKLIGAGEDDVFGDTPLAATCQAMGRIPTKGPREISDALARSEAAEQEVKEEDDDVDALGQVRRFDTTTGTYHSKPNAAETELPVHLRKSAYQEVLHGPPAERTRALNNAGLEVPSHAHYSNVEGVTHARMSFADPMSRNDLRASAANGVCLFGKNSEFSKPVNDSMLGLGKDEEMEMVYADLPHTQPLRSIGGHAPRASAFSEVPSLASLKNAIHDRIRQEWGQQGYVILRQSLFNIADGEGFVKQSDVKLVLRDQLGLSTQEVSDKALSVWVDQLTTMKAKQLHVGTFVTSLRPALALPLRRSVLESFQKLGPVDGQVRLGDWLNKIGDQDLRRTLVTAFGAEDGEDSIADMRITENVFLEVLSDLSPFGDVEQLLA